MLTDKVTTSVTFSLWLKAIFDTRFDNLVWVGPCEGKALPSKPPYGLGDVKSRAEVPSCTVPSVKFHPDHPFGSFQKL